MPSTAEVRGGTGGHEPLGGEERQVVEQVIRFENGAPGDHQAAIEQWGDPNIHEQFPHAWLLDVPQMIRHGIDAIPATAPPRQQPNPPQPRRPQHAPVAPRRSSANGVRIPRRPAGPGFAHPRRQPRPAPTPRQVITIESDSSDSSSDDSDNDLRTNAPRQAQAARRGPRRRPVVIDLTQEVPIIDLTGDD